MRRESAGHTIPLLERCINRFMRHLKLFRRLRYEREDPAAKSLLLLCNNNWPIDHCGSTARRVAKHVVDGRSVAVDCVNSTRSAAMIDFTLRALARLRDVG
jgi:hypothetical protein